MHIRTRLPLPVLATLALAANLAAQDAAPPAPGASALPAPSGGPAEVVELSALEVTASRAEGYVATRSGIGTRTGALIEETPQSISVVTADFLRDVNAHNVQESLRYTAGVRAEMYGLDNRGDWFTLRGGSEGSTLLDGLRLPLAGYWGNVRNEPFAYEQIEVLRGPSSVVAGQNGPGGVVNLVSKAPQAAPRGEVSFQVGSHETFQGSFDVTGPVNQSGTVLYRVVGLARDGGTQVDHTKDERQFIAPSLAWKVSERTTLVVRAEFQHDWSNNNVGFFPWTGMILPAPNGPIPDSTFIGEPAWDKYEGTRHRVGYHLENKLNDTWTLSHGARYDRVEGEIRGMYANFWEGGFLPDGRSVNRTWYADDTKAQTAVADLRLVGAFESARVEQTVLVAFDYAFNENAVSGASGAATPLDLYTPAYGSFALPALVYGPENKTTTNQFGVTVQDQIKIDRRFVFVPGLRYDVARADAAGAGYDTDALTGRFGVVYLAPRGFSPYLSYSESFEANGGADASGSAFDPRRGDQIELGVKWTSPDKRFTAGAAVYELHETNRLTTDPLDPTNSLPQGEVTVRGFEFEAAANLRAWQLIASYTYTDAQVTAASSTPGDATLDQQLQGIPLHAFSVWAVHKFEDLGIPGLRAGLGVRHVGETEDGTGNPLLDTPSNTLWDGMVSYERGAWTYSLNATNLFDKKYIATSLTRGDSWFGVRRQVSASATYRW